MYDNGQVRVDQSLSIWGAGGGGGGGGRGERGSILRKRVGLLYRKMLRSNEAGLFKGIVSEP